MVIDDFIASGEISIGDAMNLINNNASGNLFICKDGKLDSAISDGDIRRAIINGAKLTDSIGQFSNPNPIFLPSERKAEAEKVMREKSITAIPILDLYGRIVDIRLLLKGAVGNKKAVDVPVAIMAGGKGTRLKPYTDILPKPLIPIGDKTITEHIIDKFAGIGCKEFYMIVNYKKEFIKAYFAEKPKLESDCIPHFVDEEEFLGTGGGILLLKNHIKSTFFLTNCDILIEMDYSCALDKHKEMGNVITIICADKKMTIPYGTVITDQNGYITELREKPTYEMLTNTGFYIIEPSFLDVIPKDIKIDITDLIERCIDKGLKVGSYVINDEDWLDMGQLEEMERMKEKMGIH